MYESKICSEVFPTSHTRRLEFSVCRRVKANGQGQVKANGQGHVKANGQGQVNANSFIFNLLTCILL